MHDVVDLRSDTLTLPTAEMREAMARAEVGDDVWGEDPTVQRLEALAAVAAVAHEAGVPVHLDGARLFNAAVALKRPAAEFARHVDSVTFCVSKGLAAPVGSVICGSAEFVERARRWRKMLGGGMRQAGVLAAAGIVALERMVDRLAADHANARRLAEAVAAMPGLSVDLDSVQTNIVIIRVSRRDHERFVAATAEPVKGCAARQ